MNHGDDSSASASSLGLTTRRPQQHGLSGTPLRSILRQTPPTGQKKTTSFHTPQSRPNTRRTYNQTPSVLDQDDFGSPFSSPPPVSLVRNQPTRRGNNSFLYRQNFDSPFMSPPIAMNSRLSTRPQPLVLDPTKPTPTTVAHDAASSVHSRSSNSSVPGVSKIFKAATQGFREHASQPNVMSQTGSNLHATPALDQMESQAAGVLARSATQAGFLLKLGANIPEFKRRFFVLKPETRLYYFLSPNDMEPRGKVDLEGSRIEELEDLPDGRFRFAIHSDDHQERRIVLEARNKEIGMEWIKHMEYERVSTLKDSVDQLKSENLAQKNRIRDLEKEIENFRMIEKDRDGAIEDARSWKMNFEQLDEGLRLLTQKIRKAPTIPNKDIAENAEDKYGDEEKKEDFEMTNCEEDKNKSAESFKDAGIQNPSDDTPLKNNSTRNKVDIFHASSFEGEEDEGSLGKVKDLVDVPGTYFSALSNACQQQRELFKLASLEAATAVEDVHEANEKVAKIEKRMEKAEKHLMKLWEENCSIRKTLKQKKREKRVLVKEVKVLQQQTKEMETARPSSRSSSPTTQEVEEESLVEDTMIGSDEERLIIELEEHVASSILLHERLLAGNDYDGVGDIEINTSLEGSEIAFHRSPDISPERMVAKDSAIIDQTSSAEHAEESPIFTPRAQDNLMSLLDYDSEDANDESESDADGLNEYESLEPSVVSSACATMGDPMPCTGSVMSETHFPAISSEDEMSPERPNPIMKLDMEEEEEEAKDRDKTERELNLGLITDNSQATNKLVCPLVDVVETKQNGVNVNDESKEEFSVYHITFYSRKIGIQFQKAPPAPEKPRGLLNDAMKADLDEDMDSKEKTASELNTIANIHSFARRSSNGGKDEDVCTVASPKDIVLVCGFQEFDDSTSNQRPKLGARLVAFDGISVEIGPWTFDSIRKAIKARGRPLTLSFRNDFLTTVQRAVLTKAVMDVDAKGPPDAFRRPPSQIIPDGIDTRFLSRTPSISSAISHESDHFMNGIPTQEDLNISDAIIRNKNCCHRGISSASTGIAGHIRRTHSSASDSVSTHQNSVSSNFRSFSEAGSSTISAAFAPLVANLVKGVSAAKRKEKENHTPVYMQRSPKSLESTPQHQDFRSNLL